MTRETPSRRSRAAVRSASTGRVMTPPRATLTTAIRSAAVSGSISRRCTAATSSASAASSAIARSISRRARAVAAAITSPARFARRRCSSRPSASSASRRSLMAPHSASTPSPRTASVRTIGGRHAAFGSRAITPRMSFCNAFAPGWSILLTAITSGISMIPALRACTESPEPGIRTSTTSSATPITSTSLCPAPTVSRKTTSVPAASRSSRDCSVASATPPRCPRLPIERMNTPGSRKCSASRIRSPSSAPWREGARWIDRDHADRQPERAHVGDQRTDQRRLADAGRPGDPDRERRAGVRIQLLKHCHSVGPTTLDQRDRPCDRPPVARSHTGDEFVVSPRAAGHRRHSTARARPFRTADAVRRRL